MQTSLLIRQLNCWTYFKDSFRSVRFVQSADIS